MNISNKNCEPLSPDAVPAQQAQMQQHFRIEKKNHFSVTDTRRTFQRPAAKRTDLNMEEQRVIVARAKMGRLYAARLEDYKTTLQNRKHHRLFAHLLLLEGCRATVLAKLASSARVHPASLELGRLIGALISTRKYQQLLMEVNELIPIYGGEDDYVDALRCLARAKLFSRC